MLLARPPSPNGRRCTRRARPRCCQATRPRFRGCRCPATTRPLGDGINRDPIGELGGFNLYGLVGNNPVSHFDLSGLEAGGFDYAVDPKTGQLVPFPTTGVIGQGNRAPVALPMISPCQPGRTRSTRRAVPCENCEETGRYMICDVIEECQLVATFSGGTGPGAKPTRFYNWVEISRTCGKCATMLEQ